MNGTKLLELRKVKGMTRRALAIEAGITEESIAQIEWGNHDNPTLNTIISLSKALGCSINDLVDD